MATIHHNTVKRAARLGIELTVDDDMIVAMFNGRPLARCADAKEALDTAAREINGGAKPKRARKPRDEDEGDEDEAELEAEGDDEVEAEGDEESDEETDDEGASVVKRKYRTRYKPFKHTCGDGLTTQLAKFLKVKDDNGEERIDGAKLKRFAQLNGVWKPAYAHLNVGMQRMNVANRLRKLVRDGEKIKWGA